MLSDKGARQISGNRVKISIRMEKRLRRNAQRPTLNAQRPTQKPFGMARWRRCFRYNQANFALTSWSNATNRQVKTENVTESQLNVGR